MDLKILFRWGEEADQALALPKYETKGAAGADVRANFPPNARDGILLASGKSGLIPTGLHLAIPQGFEMQVRPRSGLAFKHGVTVLNAPGTIDSDYRGLLGVLLINHGENDFHVTHGMRVAQLVIAPVVQAEFSETQALADTARGAGGFGSTGLSA